jgi:hypothetical protein
MHRGQRRARTAVAVTFLLTGALFASWAARMPALKHEIGVGNGQLAVAFVALNAGAILGLQVGGALIPRTGSRLVLRVALPVLAAGLVTVALAWDLVALTATMFGFAAVNGVVDVAMNAHGVVVERGYGRPILSSLHAMHSLGGMAGAGVAALAAALEVAPGPHFLAVAAVATAVSVVATRGLAPSWVDASDRRRGGEAGRRPDGRGRTAGGMAGRWVAGWSGQLLALGGLAFCLLLVEGGALDWGAVYLRDATGASAGTAAAGLAGFLGAMTVGRLAGDRLTGRFGPVRAFRGGVLVAGAGFGAGLWIGTPVAGLAGLVLLGAGLSFTLPVAIGAAGRLGGATADLVARVSMLGYLGSFVGPGVIGGLASILGLPLALALPAVLITATALGTRVLRPPRPGLGPRRLLAAGTGPGSGAGADRRGQPAPGPARSPVRGRPVPPPDDLTPGDRVAG